MRRTPISVKQTNKQRKEAQYMKQKKQWRQGDVLVESVKALPEGFQHQRGRVILADGEATGHGHAFDGFTAEFEGFICSSISPDHPYNVEDEVFGFDPLA